MFIQQPEMESRFDATLADGVKYRPRYNIAPGEDLEVITNSARDQIDHLHWGLVPFWADEVDESYINARSETAHEKNAFSDAWAERPCLVLSTGFYEWQQMNGGPKQPYRIYRDAESPAFSIAGLWQETTIDDEPVRSVTILTTEPNDLVEPIHDRMPVVLPDDDETTWLEAGPDERQDLCRPYPGSDLEAYPISTRVNSPGNDDLQVIEPASTKQSGLEDF
jgi:putative SOS response-associated peptidase YedK